MKVEGQFNGQEESRLFDPQEWTTEIKRGGEGKRAKWMSGEKEGLQIYRDGWMRSNHTGGWQGPKLRWVYVAIACGPLDRQKIDNRD